MRFGAKGPNEATATACTTSAHSIGDSFRIIQHNDADVMITRRCRSCNHPYGRRRICRHARSLDAQRRDPEKAEAVRGIVTATGL